MIRRNFDISNRRKKTILHVSDVHSMNFVGTVALAIYCIPHLAFCVYSCEKFQV